MSLFGTIEVKSNRLRGMDLRMRQQAGRVVRSYALQCEAKAKVLAPVDTGALRSSIQAQEENELSWVVGPAVDYGIYVEYGTVHMAAQPYMTPTAEELRSPFIGAMNEVVERSS